MFFCGDIYYPLVAYIYTIMYHKVAFDNDVGWPICHKLHTASPTMSAMPPTTCTMQT